MRKIIYSYIIGTILTTSNLMAQQTVYLGATGAGNMDGTSVSNAYGNFGTAMIDINSEGDKLVIIGTVSTSGTNLTSKSFAFTIEGYDTTSTIVGDGSSARLFTINGPTTANVTFKNLTFLNNNTTLAGGSVFFNNNAGATASFENCTFDGNSVDNAAGGGAIYFANGNLSISNCSFVNNSSTDEGGAIFGVSGSITITNTLFRGNSAASKGGALYANAANFTISGSTFYENVTTNTTAGAGGSAFYVAAAGSNNNITNCTFFQNTTGNTNLDYGTIRTDDGNTTITNSLFYDNKTNNDTGPTSDWGSGPNGTQTFNTSIAQWISNNIDNQDEGSGSITAIKNGGGAAANLESSNLTFNEASGYVEYNSVYVGENSPIDFGSDGNDVGAWNSGLTLLPPDTTAPVITVIGDNPATVELGATYTDAGATADGGETVTSSGTVDTSTVGTYTITYSATDAAGNTGTATRTVNVVDTTAPVITVIGDNPATVELGATYTDAGATADGGETVTSSGTVDTTTVGTYTITYSATDAAGNTGTATRTVNVVDTTAPVITVIGDNPATVELGATYTDAGATADGGETVTSSGTVDTTTVGTYTITYSATDAAGNNGTATRTVNVVDTTAPVITVIGDNPATVELGATYTDAGATADGGETVTSSGTVDTSTVGTYTITYSATDAAGNTGTATRTVNVVDTTAPVITVIGDNPATVELGAIYTDAGATADGGETVTSSGTVDTSTVGTYTITYSATDAAGNTGTATRTVNVVDTTAPVITVIGDNPATVELGATYTDAGATADGGETVTSSGTVDTSTVGTYTITYSATDAAGNTGTATRTVNVVDTTAPVITVIGDNPATVELGATYTDAGATADGGETVTSSGTVDTSTVGTYTITYSATDAAGNTGTATRTVNVVDTTAPVITVIGDNPATVELGATYTDAGATADGGETVTSSGTVDTSTVGTYTITYSATDAAGNTGTATRTVNVVDNLSTEDHEDEIKKIVIFPNPTSTTLSIYGIKNYDIKIINELGQITLQANKTNKIDVSSLPSGVYLIMISDGPKSSIKQFIKQ